MNIIFDKTSLKVVSISDRQVIKDEQAFLKATFPSQYNNLSIFKVNKQLTYNPVFLSVVLDGDKNPHALLYRGKEIYKIDDEEKKRQLKIREEQYRESIKKNIPSSLLKSINQDLINCWIRSPYSYPETVALLKSYDYFINKRLLTASWWGPFTDAGGYANMNREIVFRLHNHHIITKADICPTAPQISSVAQYYLSKHSSLNLSKLKKHPKIWAFTPIPHPNSQGKNIFFTMMETESLHPEFARICNAHAQEIWVPSSHNKRVFTNYGVKKPIYVMPLGVDENLYDFVPREIGVIDKPHPFVTLLGKPFEQGINKFRFITLFGWSYRKGVDVLIKSFVKEFNASDDVALIILSRHSGSPAADHIAVIRAETQRYASAVRGSNYPQVILYPHIMPERDIPEFLRMGHAFVHLSRGEGFSLCQIEASACGLPVISTNNTGMSEYLTENNAFLVTNTENEMCSPEMHWITSYYHGQLFPKLGEEQVEQARKHMRYVINNYEIAVKKGKNLTRDVQNKYTWKHATSNIAKRLEEIHRNSV